VPDIGPMQSPLTTIGALGHIATRRQLIARGHTGYQLTAAVRSGTIRRIRRGWYATPLAEVDQAEAVRVGGRVSHTSAARRYGFWSGFDTRLHVTVQRGSARLRRRRRPRFDTPDNSDREVVVHWIAPGRQDLTSKQTWCVGVSECLRGVVAIADRETAIACLETAMHVLGWSEDQIHRVFANASPRVQARAAQARRGPESGPESLVGQRLRRKGLHPVFQVQIPTVGRVDMLVDDWLVIEVDGRAYHSSPEQFERDRHRDARLVALGYTVLRFSYLQVTTNWPFVERTILATVSQFRKR
jgi:very-short-patch-repair endonuclease